MTKQDLTTKLNKQLNILAQAEALVASVKAEVAATEEAIAAIEATEAAKAEPEAPTFEAALASFVSGAQAIMDEHKAKHFPNIPRDVLTVSMGRRYAKIVRTSECGNHRSVHCFVDRTNGDVLKAASWKAPAKHARGNIYREDNGTGSMSPYGAAYLR
jgi:hypothetical protein